MNTKYIFVTGGVASSLGKGIIAASLAKLLQARGLRVTIQKFDPYINIDPGTLNPYEHGECYVTEDGAETDLDLGHYERFLGVHTSKANNVTTGKIYNTVITKEREGAYLGKTVQIVPHITDEIKRRMLLLGGTGEYDIIITEIGGTVGDMESQPFVESVRQLQWELPEEDLMSIHLTLVPYLSAAGELKTKPTQHSVQMLQQSGVKPDVIVCRTEHPLSPEIRKKVAQFCNVSADAVVRSLDAPTIYEVPLMMHEQRLDNIILEKTGLSSDGEPDLDKWNEFLGKLKGARKEVRIGLVGKYVSLQDAYKSIDESLLHACAYHDRRLRLDYINSEHIHDGNVEQLLKDHDGIVVAPGFGQRGIEGKYIALRWCREHDVPTFGICLGMQCMVIEFARNVLGLADANSTEMDEKTPNNVIDLMEDQKTVTNLGGTMRLGAYACRVKPGTKVAEAYGKTDIEERHRHRFEFNDEYRKQFEDAGMTIAGVNPESGLAEVIELTGHRWYIGTQYHPEYSSTVLNPHPLFMSFINAAITAAEQ